MQAAVETLVKALIHGIKRENFHENSFLHGRVRASFRGSYCHGEVPVYFLLP